MADSKNTRTAPWDQEGVELDKEKATAFFNSLNAELDREKAAKAKIVEERDALKVQVKGFEQKDMTETQRLQSELEEAKKSVKSDPKLELDNARLRLALEHGLTVAQAERLRGGTPDELAADVEELKSILQPVKQESAPKDAPSGRFINGSEKDGPQHEDTDPDKMLTYF